MPLAALDAGNRAVAVGSVKGADPALRLTEQRQNRQTDFERLQGGGFNPGVERRAGAVTLDFGESIIAQGRLIGISRAPGELARGKVLAELNLQRPVGKSRNSTPLASQRI